jgi:sulfur relay (sulfurtransferase) DsrF/TusC family protein
MSSGGGSVAKQFAAGGTMEGTLNVTGQYLSGGVDLLTIFAGGGDDIEVNTVVRSSSANWNNAYNTGTVYQVNSASYATIDFANSKFFPLSGGTITGATVINNNLTVNGNLTATGTTTFNNTVFSVTSALSVVHVGEGPAVWVGNSGLGDIASFYDIDENIEVFHIGGSNGTFPNVGVRTSTPNKTFTVVGEISSTSDITTSGSIGIGTPTPNERLTVSGNISASGTVTADTIDFSNSTSFLQPSSDVRSWYEYGIGPSIPVSETAPSGLFFKPDGLVVYIIGFSLDLVRSFALTTPWDITTQSNTASSTLLVTAAETTPHDLHFSPDGVYLFIVGQTGTVPQPGDRVYRFTLSTPWDITTAVYDGIANALSVSDKETTPLGLTMSNDGTRLYVCGTDSDNIDQYNLTTSWSLSTAVHAHTINIAAQESAPTALAFNSDGTRLYVTGSTGDDITEYRLATPWEISTASYFSESFTILTETAPTGLFINSITNDAYLIGSSLDRVLQFKTDRQLNYNGDSFVMGSQLYVNGRAEFKNTLYANSNATILGALVVGNNITGTGLTITGTTTLANTTNAVTVSIATGATALAKTILIGTNSRFTSPTNVTIGSLDDSGGTTFQHPVILNKNAIFDNAITVKGSFDPISSAAVATGAIAISDTFTEAADTLLQNHIPDIGTSWSRIQVNSATTSFTIEASTDTLKPTATAPDNGVIYIENTTLTNPDYEVSVDLPVQASSDDVIWLIARYQDVNNFYGVKWSTTAANCTLYKRVGGTFTQLGVTPYINPATGSSNLSLRVVGNRIAVVNGGQTKIAFTDDSLTAAGKAGLAGGNIGVLSTDDLINTWRLDNFKVQYYTDAASTFEKGDVIIGSGKVGIGTASPSESLTVVGNISASGNITANNLVYTSENQSISGVKTFNDLPIIPITPISDDNPTSKEYVDSLVSSVSSSIQDSLLDIITNSSSVFSLSTIYNNKVVQCTSTTPITATLPASLPQGFNCMLIQLSSGQINIQGDSGVTVGSFGNLVKTAGQHAPVSIICLAPGIYNVSGNLI